jgi:methylmalonyl-CoA mutase cobalamin-binding subunit
VIVKTFLEDVSDSPPLPSAPLLAVTTPSGQRHEFGALMAAATAQEHGWGVVYLGPDLPAEEIAAAVKQLQPQALALSVVYQEAGTRLREELQKLKRYLYGQVTIIAGGRVVPQLRSYLEELDIHIVDDFTELPAVLSGLSQ